MCGSITSDNDVNSLCNYADQDPSDDQVNIRCDDPSHIEMTTVDGRKFTFSPYFYYWLHECLTVITKSNSFIVERFFLDYNCGAN